MSGIEDAMRKKIKTAAKEQVTRVESVPLPADPAEVMLVDTYAGLLTNDEVIARFRMSKPGETASRSLLFIDYFLSKCQDPALQASVRAGLKDPNANLDDLAVRVSTANMVQSAMSRIKSERVRQLVEDRPDKVGLALFVDYYLSQCKDPVIKQECENALFDKRRSLQSVADGIAAADFVGKAITSLRHDVVRKRLGTDPSPEQVGAWLFVDHFLSTCPLGETVRIKRLIESGTDPETIIDLAAALSALSRQIHHIPREVTDKYIANASPKEISDRVPALLFADHYYGAVMPGPEKDILHRMLSECRSLSDIAGLACASAAKMFTAEKLKSYAQQASATLEKTLKEEIWRSAPLVGKRLETREKVYQGLVRAAVASIASVAIILGGYIGKVVYSHNAAAERAEVQKVVIESQMATRAEEELCKTITASKLDAQSKLSSLQKMSAMVGSRLEQSSDPLIIKEFRLYVESRDNLVPAVLGEGFILSGLTAPMVVPVQYPREQIRDVVADKYAELYNEIARRGRANSSVEFRAVQKGLKARLKAVVANGKAASDILELSPSLDYKVEIALANAKEIALKRVLFKYERLALEHQIIEYNAQTERKIAELEERLDEGKAVMNVSREIRVTIGNRILLARGGDDNLRTLSSDIKSILQEAHDKYEKMYDSILMQDSENSSIDSSMNACRAIRRMQAKIAFSEPLLQKEALPQVAYAVEHELYETKRRALETLFGKYDAALKEKVTAAKREKDTALQLHLERVLLNPDEDLDKIRSTAIDLIRKGGVPTGKQQEYERAVELYSEAYQTIIERTHLRGVGMDNVLTDLDRRVSALATYTATITSMDSIDCKEALQLVEIRKAALARVRARFENKITPYVLESDRTDSGQKTPPPAVKNPEINTAPPRDSGDLWDPPDMRGHW